MNREPYGKKCKCSHFESDHEKEMNKMEHPAITHARTMYGILPLLESKIKYKNCNACACKKFESIKRRGLF